MTCVGLASTSLVDSIPVIAWRSARGARRVIKPAQSYDAFDMIRSAFASLASRAFVAAEGSVSVALAARQCSGQVTQDASVPLTESLEAEFARDAEVAAATIAALPEEHRTRILHKMSNHLAPPGSVRYLNTLFREVDTNNDGLLCRCVTESMLSCRDALVASATSLPRGVQSWSSERSKLAVAKTYQITFRRSSVKHA
jgi:hypothetical protein